MPRIVRSAAWTAALSVALAALVAALWSTTAQAGAAVAAPGPASPGELLTLLAAVAALTLALWLGLSALAAVAAHLPGRIGMLCATAARAWAPAFTRRTAAVLVGAALGGALAPGSALAETPPAPAAAVALPDLPGPGYHVALPPAGELPQLEAVPAPGFVTEAEVKPGASAGTRHTGEAPAPGWVPERPRERPQASATLVTTAAGTTQAADIVVHRGDTLWDIVARQLGPDASDAEVAAAWPRWYDANRQVIGDDPDLILPGQILRAPAAAPR